MSKATLKRHQRDFDRALGEMVDNAMTLADSIIALAPDRPVTDEEIARVEQFVVDHIMTEGRKNVVARGGGPVAIGLLEGPGVEAFRQAFAARLAAQAGLRATEARGNA